MNATSRSHKSNRLQTPRRSFRHKRGVALLTSLVMMVILSVLLVSLLATTRIDRLSSHVYGNSVSVDELAIGALESIEADLIREIEAGSDFDSTINPIIYEPKESSTAVPARFVNRSGQEDEHFPSLIRRSMSGTNFSDWEPDSYSEYEDFPTDLTASSVSTSIKSVRGRSMTAERWNTPVLLDAAQLDKFTLPEWVYWTSDGPESAPTPDQVVGRFAYVMYDVSGLIDANVAGFPSTGGPSADIVSGKGTPLLIDLLQIPGFEGNQNAIDELTLWRNAKGWADGFNSFQEKWSEDGYVGVYANSASQYDRTLMTRQELIRYFNNNSDFSTDSLPFLTTFSRAVNAPIWSPRTHDDSTIQYADLAETDSSFNRNMATIRDPNTQEPFLVKRFPLSRLDDFENPVTNRVRIKQYFGLNIPDDGSKPWTYDHGDATRILTLAEVAQAGREPDFFELLQAGILSGSVGLTSQDRTHADTRWEDSSPSRHIIQIGANIIDQWDSDGYPTHISFDYNDSTLPSPDPRVAKDTNIYGIEDLPYISEIIAVVYRDGNGTSTTVQRGYFPVEIWNPHREPSLSATTGPRPTSFRVNVESDTSNMRRQGGSEPPSRIGNPYIYDDTIPGGQPARIEFDANTTDFREPEVLRTSNTKSGPSNGLIDGIRAVPGPSITPTGSNPTTANQDIDFSDLSQNIANDPAPIFKLQYWDGSDWHTYQQLDAVLYRSIGDQTHTPTSWRKGMTRIDPRGIRLGMSEGSSPSKTYDRSYQSQETQSSAQASYWGKPRGTSTFAPSASMSRNFYSWNDFNSGGFQLSNYSNNGSDNRTSGTTQYPVYRDRDGVMRFGDANRNDSTYPMADGNEQERPIVLNRPFRNVGELGYVFRDLPWKTLDFFSDTSADAGLLDLFTMEDSETVAGKVNLNSAPPEVIEAILSGARQDEIDSTNLTQTEINKIVSEIESLRDTSIAPFKDRSDIVMALGPKLDTLDGINKRREAAVRALSDSSNFRTWNVMIDLVAQSGKCVENNLSDFLIEGERRLWLHLAIDRYTGKIIDQKIEAVYE